MRLALVRLGNVIDVKSAAQEHGAQISGANLYRSVLFDTDFHLDVLCRALEP